MLIGVLEFVEATVASQLLSPTAQATFDQSVKSNGSYLDLWSKYSEQEWERSLRQAAGKRLRNTYTALAMTASAITAYCHHRPSACISRRPAAA